MEELYKLILQSVSEGKIDKENAVQICAKLKQYATTTTKKNNDIAIIGLAARLPMADSIEEFWDNIRNKANCIIECPPLRKEDVVRYLNYKGIDNEERYFAKAAYLREIDRFDYNFFRLTPKEASLMGPEQRLFLETAWEALEDAGYGGEALAGSKTGIYVGYYANARDSYSKIIYDVEPSAIPLSITGNVPAVIPGRLSYLLNLKGPSMVIDTACSSSLVALHLACNAIKSGECDLAIAGGIKINILPVFTPDEKLGIESSDWQTRTFDDHADGSGIGEGVVVVLLKPLVQAVEDQDHIYAVIKGSVINQDGASNGLTAPNPAAQAELIVKALEETGINPETISYIEAHGTGTELGDPIELKGLEDAFKKYTDKKQFCAIGSVKSNIGHLYECAGITGLLKAVLALKNKEIPPTIHFNAPNRKISFVRSPVYVNTKLRKWETTGYPRRCGVSSFGMSGTNCHVILEEYVDQTGQSKAQNTALAFPVFTLSAKTAEALDALVQKYGEYVDENSDFDLNSVCYTANTGRGSYRYRIAMIVRDKEDFVRKIKLLRNIPYKVRKEPWLFYGEHKLVPESKEIKGVGEITERQKTALTDAVKRKINELTQAGKGRMKLIKEICDLYVSGADVEWRRLYSDQKIGRVSLPVYPFARERCWVNIPCKQNMSGRADFSGMYYELRWRLEPAETNIRKEKTSGAIVVFKNESPMATGIEDELIKRLRLDGREVIEITVSQNFHEVDKDKYVIRGEEEDYERLLTEIKDRKITRIIHMLTVTKSKEVSTLTELKKSQVRGVYSLFYLVRAILKAGIDDDIDIVLLTNYVHQVTREEERINPENAPMIGLGKIVGQEYPQLKCRCIDIDDQIDAGIINDLLYEIEADNRGYVTAYRKGKRYVEEFNEVVLDDYPEEKVELKEDGVYIITGGTGGIGIEIARFMTKKANVKLALINRSEFPTRAQWDEILERAEDEKLCKKIKALKEMEAAGSEVVCYSADVSKVTEIEPLISHLRKKYNRISGIVHSAGLAGGGVIVTREETSFDNVLQPKVQGTWLLDQLTREDKPDFFVMFSSGLTVSGEAGQGDYVAANSYLDSYAAYRGSHGLKTITINWVSWKESGMSVDYGINVDTLFKAITTEKAICGFNEVLNRSLTRVIIGEINYNEETLSILEALPFKLSSGLCAALEENRGRVVNRPTRANNEDMVMVENGRLVFLPIGKRIKPQKDKPVHEVILKGRLDSRYTEIEKELGQIIGELLGFAELDVYDNLIELGVDSIAMMRIVAKVRSRFGLQLNYNVFIQGITVAKLADLIMTEHHEEQIPYPALKADPENMYQPFPLTDIQMAYLIGREAKYELSGVSTQNYMELETKLDIKRFNLALQKVIKRHPMLRAVILPSRQQQILAEVPDYIIEVEDLSDLDDETKNKRIIEQREKLSHHQFKTDEWPLFAFKAFKLSPDTHYFFILNDLLISDGMSVQIMYQELVAFYDNPDLQLPEIPINFRDYMAVYQQIKESPLYTRDKEYWLANLENFPSAPLLPLKCDPSSVNKVHFKRLSMSFESEDWKKLKEQAKQHGLTPTAILGAAYAEVLGFWGNQSRIPINLPAFNRLLLHEDIDKVIGDFTSLFLLEVDLNLGTTVWDRAEQVQKNILEALEHRHYDGVEYIREFAKHNNLGARSAMPYVFTSMLFENSIDDWSRLGKFITGVNPSSQVYLDNQAMEINGSLVINWDYVEELFAEDVIKEMFAQYTKMIRTLIDADEEEYLPTVGESDQRLLEEYNSTDEEIEPSLLHGLFIEQTKRTPDNIAVVFEDQSINYRELDQKSNQVARYLKEQGIGKKQVVGVLAERSIESIINIIGILKSGGAYVPIDPAYPESRREYMLTNSECQILLKPDLYQQNNLNEYSVDEVEISNVPEDLAYIIYTSGSTGRPKGVAVTHQAAANTILDINRKFNVKQKDRILGVSSMGFDLSVYDIFGALSVGAALVIVPDQRDVTHLAKVIEEQSITIWNSVPAIMDLMLDSIEKTGQEKSSAQNNSALIFDQPIDIALVKSEYDEERKYYWSSAIFWRKENDQVFIGDMVCPDFASALFPEFYFLTQNGITLNELTAKFRQVDQKLLNEFIQKLIQKKILIHSIQSPQEVFYSQARLFRNRYSEKIVYVEEEYEKFKHIQLNRRFGGIKGKRIPLDQKVGYPQVITGRRTYRTFDETVKIPFVTLSHLFSVFRQKRDKNGITYNYACAGGLYPIDVFFYVREGRVQGLDKGLYYYSPIDNSFYLVNENAVIDSGAHYYTNKSIFNSSAVSIFLLYNAEVTMPKYSSLGYFYACIDVGIMVATLTYIAELLEIGVCSIGNMNFDKISEYFNLTPEQVWIHTIEIGLKPDRKNKEATSPLVCEQISEETVEDEEAFEVQDMLAATASSDGEGRTNSLRLALLSGDWIPVKLPDRIRRYYGNCEVISLGGATEGAIWSIYYPTEEMKEGLKSIPYGRPLANQKFYVLNFRMELCPIDVLGELYIGGSGVAEGYYNDETKTRAAFIEHPEFGRIYKTGDYGVMRKDNSGGGLYIEFLGRKDQQVKIRGYRVELGEVESCLLDYEGITNVAVIEKNDKNMKKILCAYIVSDRDLQTLELKTYLSKLLPDYMIPSCFMFVEKIPLTNNGKVDKNALPEPEFSVRTKAEIDHPRNEVEERLMEICKSILEVEDLGIHDDFFEMGGNSLLIVRIHTEIERLYPGKIGILEMFDNPTIAKLSEYILKENRQVLKDELL